MFLCLALHCSFPVCEIQKVSLFAATYACTFVDPFDELDDNEVHIKSSHREFQTADGMETDIIVGDVLVE